MAAKNRTSGRTLSPGCSSAWLRWCSLALGLLCGVDGLQTSTRRPTLLHRQERATAIIAPREVPAESRLPVGGAALHDGAPELERRACSPASPKEPVRGRLNRAVVLTANAQLNLPMGFGRVLMVGGRPYLFCLEPHYHPPGGGIAPEGWHKGVTVYHAEPGKERVL